MDIEITKYVGLVCEVSTMGNDLLISGKISRVITENGVASLEVVDINRRKMPHGAFDLPVKIKIHSKEYGNVVLGGKIFIGNEDFWRICDIRCFTESERRGFFRVKILSQAKISVGDDETRTYKGVITNLSLSGLKLVIKDKECRLKIGDNIIVSGLGVNGIDEFTFNCTVKRVGESPVAGWMYGCELQDMDHAQSDNLCKLIFTLQRKEINKKRRRI